MAFDCRPAATGAATLTEEQRERIATNKAAALARLAKAHSLAAWASQPSHSGTNEGSHNSTLVRGDSAQILLSSKLSVLVHNDDHTRGHLPHWGHTPESSTCAEQHCQVAANASNPSGQNSSCLAGREAVANERLVVKSVVGGGLTGGVEGRETSGASSETVLCTSLSRWLGSGVQSVNAPSLPPAPHFQNLKGGQKVRRSPRKALQSTLLLKRTPIGKADTGRSNGARGFQETPAEAARLGTPTQCTPPSVGLFGSKSIQSEGLRQSKRSSVGGAAKGALDVFANAGSVARSAVGEKTHALVQTRPLKVESGPQSAAKTETAYLMAGRDCVQLERGLPDKSLGPLTACSGAEATFPTGKNGPTSASGGAGSSNTGWLKGGAGESATLNGACTNAATEPGKGSVADVAVGASKGADKKVPFLQWPKQEFDYFLVIDFECTCDNVAKLDPAEIIEFPSVLLNARTLRIEDSFRVFCRPQVHSTLTAFCTQLTGIRQDQVDAGVSLQEALAAHDTWLRSKNLLDKPNRFAVVTWTDWDCKVMLEMECKWKRIQKPAYFNRWINLKHPFAKVFPKARGTCHGLKGHVTYAGVTWEGRAHSGLDDATNTARLAAALIRQGGKLSITGSFTIYAADGSKLERVLRKRPLVQADGNAREGPVANGQGGKCHCGVKRKRRTVKKPGLTHGQTFFSCGKWTITGGGCCEYFEWVQDADCK